MSLFAEMDKLKKAGFAFWLEDVELSDGAKFPSLDILEFDATWVHVCEPGKPDDESFWIYLGYIERAQIVVEEAGPMTGREAKAEI